MLAINMSDVINVLTSMRADLIAIGVIIAAGIIVKIAVRKVQKPKKRLIRGTTSIAMILGIVICVNLICTGPMSTMLSLVTGKVRSRRRPPMRPRIWL